MVRLSTFAKLQIVRLKYEHNYPIKQIASVLHERNEIKVSRKSVSSFLKKYAETKSIDDKPRSGRHKKLSQQEIDQIGEITRLNRDITASKIREKLKLNNVSTYTILRASKLFEWNSIANGRSSSQSPTSKKRSSVTSGQTNFDLKLVSDEEISTLKNNSSSAMVFATKLLYRLFDLNELIGHNVSGKTFNRLVKDKKPLDEKRVGYIKWLVETNYPDDQHAWMMCRRAINKSIRTCELKHQTMNKKQPMSPTFANEEEPVVPSYVLNMFEQRSDKVCCSSFVDSPNDDNVHNGQPKTYIDISNNTVKAKNDQKIVNLNLISERELDQIRSQLEAEESGSTSRHWSAARLSVKLVDRLFACEEMAHMQMNPMEINYDARIDYIKWIIAKYYDDECDLDFDSIWSECSRAMRQYRLAFCCLSHHQHLDYIKH